MITYSVTVHALDPTPTGYVTRKVPLVHFTVRVQDGESKEELAAKKLPEVFTDPIPDQIKYTFTLFNNKL